jgi:hypothetical protein
MKEKKKPREMICKVCGIKIDALHRGHYICIEHYRKYHREKNAKNAAANYERIKLWRMKRKAESIGIRCRVENFEYDFEKIDRLLKRIDLDIIGQIGNGKYKQWIAKHS